MREQVILRDRHCVFPWCGCDARAPTSTTSSLRPTRRGRTTGPDEPQNLAPLCRRHHRAKTAKRWRYERTEDGSYAWTSPHQKHYLVNGSGTLALADH